MSRVTTMIVSSLLRIFSEYNTTLKHLNSQKKQWLVFTDMDGSLLDHYTYQFDKALPTLATLRKQNIPVIPVTSKTLAELTLLRQSLDNAHPFIVENGAAVFIPKSYFHHQPDDTIETDDYWIKEFVARRDTWQTLIARVNEKYQDQFTTFADAGITGIMAMTGLDEESASRAAKRQYGEPLLWQGSSNDKLLFTEELQALGAVILEGGRFMHVSGKTDKGLALLWLAEVYKTNHPETHIVTMALGDSNNDLAMLEIADYAVVIRSPTHALPPINRKANLFVSTHTGPQGWSEGVNSYIDFCSSSK